MHPSSAPRHGCHVTETVLRQPTRVVFAHDDAGDRIDAATDTLARHQYVRFHTVLRNAPQLTGAHQPGLHFVGNVQGIVLLTQLFDRREIAFCGHREPVGGGNRFHNHAGDVLPGQSRFHGIEIVEWYVNKFVGRPVRR